MVCDRFCRLLLPVVEPDELELVVAVLGGGGGGPSGPSGPPGAPAPPDAMPRSACIRSPATDCDRLCRLVLSVVDGEVDAAVVAVALVVRPEALSNWLRMDCTSLVSRVSGSELLVPVELAFAAVVPAVLLLVDVVVPPDCSETRAACKSLASFWNGFIPPEPACAPLDDDVFVLVESPAGVKPGGGPGGG